MIGYTNANTYGGWMLEEYERQQEARDEWWVKMRRFGEWVPECPICGDDPLAPTLDPWGDYECAPCHRWLGWLAL